jgi:ankyrin repeat protein
MSHEQGERLIASANAGDLPAVKELLAVEMLAPPVLGRALRLVADKDPGGSFVAIAECLIAAGADVDFQDENDKAPPLAYAVLSRNLEIVRLLVEAGADPALGYEHESSAIERCLYGGGGREAIVELLKAARPRRLNGNTLIAAADFGAPGLVRQAIEAGVAVDAMDRNGTPVLLVAIQAQQLEIVEIRLAHGADPNSTRQDGSESALTEAIRTQQEEIVQRLIAAGADVNASVESGYEMVTPLALAESLSSEAIAQLLRDAGATD